jgi:hypothetical protein
MKKPERVLAALSRIMVVSLLSGLGFQNDITLKSSVNTEDGVIRVARGAGDIRQLHVADSFA